MLSASEFVKKVRNHEIDPVEHILEVLDKCREINPEYNYFSSISEELALNQARAVKLNPKGKLAGLPVSVKDCICVKGVESRAGSKILSGYVPVFNATAIERIMQEGAIIIGKTSQDEFGFGSFNVNVGVDFKAPLNPYDRERVCGGSSGGSGGIAAIADFPHISLGESTGGSIVSPSAYCGVAGLSPTYGLVSRYGLMDYGNSLDKIGPIAKTVSDTALMLSAIAGKDHRDSTSLDCPRIEYTDYAAGMDNGVHGLNGVKLGVIKEAFGDGTDPEVGNIVQKAIRKMESKGAQVEEVSLPLSAKYGVSAYYLVAMCEASTNLAKYCGMRYGASGKIQGNFNEYFSQVRSANFSAEAKRRIIIGTYARMAGFREAFYLKALKVRAKIIAEYKSLFNSNYNTNLNTSWNTYHNSNLKGNSKSNSNGNSKNFDLLVSPTMPNIAPRFNEVKKMTPLQNYMVDFLTVSPNLSGLPHMSLPVGKSEGEGMPVGMMLIADHLHEHVILQAASAYERCLQ